ncbi:MAG TPA: tetratricopeptide repeat protein [Bacteroidia bacterium]|nr:tetratricopeptide repeat protein [Bacteroidia bacterium]
MRYFVKLSSVTGFILSVNFFNAQTISPPINSGDIIREAYKLTEEEKYDEAIADYLKVDENDTNYVISCVELANLYSTAKKDSAAIALCDKMLQEKTEYDESFYIVKGNALDNAGKLDESVKVYNEGLAKYPNAYMLYYNMGINYLRKKDYARAETNFKKALAINPYHGSSHMRLGLTAFNEGKLIQSILSYMFFLQLENTTKRSEGVILLLQKIVKREVEPEGPLAESSEQDDFSELEAIIKSKVALNGTYKSKIPLQFDLSKQLQLLFEKLTYNSNDKGFWMQTYVPYFTKMQKAGYFEDMIYYSFSSIDNEEIKKWLKSHESQENKFTSWAQDVLENSVACFDENMNGTIQKVPHYYSNSKLEAVGVVKNKKNVGYWKFYHHNGFLKSEGLFNQTGEREGLWKFYYDDGTKKAEENYKNGVLYGAYIKYRQNGSRSMQGNYEKGMYEGKVETFYNTDAIKGSYYFKADKKNGKEISYFSNGQKKYEVDVINEVLQGDLVQYYESGKVYEKSTFKNDKRNGPFVLYYEDGTKMSEGVYKDDKIVGEFKSYNNNGTLQKQGVYSEKGLTIGSWKEYNKTGKVLKDYQYSEKGKLISYKDYTGTGKLENELIYKNEELVESKSYDETGKIIHDQKKNGKNFAGAFFYINGNKLSEGNYVKDEKEGEWKYYKEDGWLSEISMYKNGKPDGKSTTYFSNGKIESECLFVNDQRDGLYKGYYINGTIEKQGYYREGQEQGTWYYYNQDGTLAETRYYLNGEETGIERTYGGSGVKYKESTIKDGYTTKLLYFDSTGKVLNKSEFPLGTGNINYSYTNGKPRLKGQYKGGLAEGTSYWYFANGNIDVQVNYINNNKEGTETFYYENGQKKREDNYFRDNLHGTSSSYYENGNPNEQLNYWYGELNGVQKYFYENKALYRTINYNYGKAEGVSRYYSEDGQLIISKYFENDILKSYSYLNKSGKYDSIPLKNETGKIVSYFPNGQKSLEYELEYGFAKGKRTEYYTSGKVKKSENFYYGVFDGAQKQFYANGNVKSEENYLLDEKHGYAKYYYENGKLKQEGKYLNGSKFGVWKYYDNTGKLSKKVNYYDGMQMP